MDVDNDRAFDLIWGSVTGGICLALGAAILWWWLPAHRRSVFGTRIDPKYKLQFGYGLFTMAMFGTNVGCRFIPHDHLAFVHPAFAIITLVLVAGLGPRVIAMALSARRTPAPALISET